MGKYVKDFDMCQRMKNKTEGLARKLKLSKVPEKPQTHLTVDFITKLPLMAEKDAILVVCNRLSKMTHFIVTTKGTSAEELAQLFRNNMWKLHRLPESSVSDRRPQFVADLIKKLNQMLGVEIKLSPIFHFQTDSQMERMNQELEQYLRFFIDYRQKEWPEWLASAKFTINNKIHLVTKISLFIANYRRELRIGVDIRRKGKMEKATEFAERMKRIQKEAGVALRRAQEEIK